jgi:hypothetical protein
MSRLLTLEAAARAAPVKVGGGLNYVEGPMGAGKTLYGVRSIVDRLLRGQYAITNVELREDAFDRIGRHVARTSRRKAQRVADNCRRYYVYETQLSEAIRYRPAGKGEARALFLWDEGHNDLNNRKWKDDGRADLLEWATQLRKLGYVGYLLSQHADNTDAALRRVCNYRVRLQNQREQTRVLGMRVTPLPLFLACWYPTNVPLNSGRAVKPVKVERYFLGWHRNLYDTMALFHGLSVGDDEEGRTVVLPEGGRRALPAEGGKPVAPVLL